MGKKTKILNWMLPAFGLSLGISLLVFFLSQNGEDRASWHIISNDAGNRQRKSPAQDRKLLAGAAQLPAQQEQKIGIYTGITGFRSKEDVLRFIEERQKAIASNDAAAQQSFNSRLACELAERLPVELLSSIMMDDGFYQSVAEIKSIDSVSLYERLLQLSYARLNLSELSNKEGAFDSVQKATWERVTARIEFQRDPESAFEELLSRPEASKLNLEPVAIEATAGRQPKNAFSYFLSDSCSTRTLTPLATKLISVWVADNPDKTGVMLNACTDLKAKDIGIKILVDTLVDKEPESARLWAAAISDASLRSQTLELLNIKEAQPQ